MVVSVDRVFTGRNIRSTIDENVANTAMIATKESVRQSQDPSQSSDK